MASYYVTIDGQRYDRRLLETALKGKAMTFTPGMLQTLLAVYDAGKFTPTERRTLEYLERLPGSDASKALLRTFLRFHRPGDGTGLARAEAAQLSLI